LISAHELTRLACRGAERRGRPARWDQPRFQWSHRCALAARRRRPRTPPMPAVASLTRLLCHQATQVGVLDRGRQLGVVHERNRAGLRAAARTRKRLALTHGVSFYVSFTRAAVRADSRWRREAPVFVLRSADQDRQQVPRLRGEPPGDHEPTASVAGAGARGHRRAVRYLRQPGRGAGPPLETARRWRAVGRAGGGALPRLPPAPTFDGSVSGGASRGVCSDGSDAVASCSSTSGEEECCQGLQPFSRQRCF
jgi:hypothetical protein